MTSSKEDLLVHPLQPVKQAVKQSLLWSQVQLRQPPALRSWKPWSSWTPPTTRSLLNLHQILPWRRPLAASFIRTSELHLLQGQALYQSYLGDIGQTKYWNILNIFSGPQLQLSPQLYQHHHLPLRVLSIMRNWEHWHQVWTSKHKTCQSWSFLNYLGSGIPVSAPSSTSTPCPTSSGSRKKRPTKAKKTRLAFKKLNHLSFIFHLTGNLMKISLTNSLEGLEVRLPHSSLKMWTLRFSTSCFYILT